MENNLKTQADIELFAHHVYRLSPMPENLRLLVIMEPSDFDTLVKEIVPPWAHIDTEQSDRFIYTSQIGIAFGIKKRT
jgi:hypothetical protein